MHHLSVSARGLVVASLVAASAIALQATADADARTRAYKSPGYPGVRRLPAVRPPAPPRPLVLAQAGERPQLLVDAAGTAHIVWNERGADGPDTLRYCRLRRGATGCENPPATQRLVPDQPYDGGNAPQFNSEIGSPRVLALNDQLALLTTRYPNTFTSPDGGSSATNTYLFASDDGGSSFGPPALVGTAQTSGVPAAYGPPEAPRLALISDTQTGGAHFQAIAPGRFTRAIAILGADGYDSTAAPFEGSVAVAFRSLSDVVTVRIWSGQGEVHDPTTWSSATFPGDRPRLASGPAGLYVLSAATGGRRSLTVRRVTRSGVGAPATIPATAGATIGDLVQDDGGRLHVTYRRTRGTAIELVRRSSLDGRAWSAPEPLRRTSPTTGIWATDAAAAADGGGFAVVHQTSTGAMGPIVALPFGARGPTGRPGLGSLAGGAADPGVVEQCQRIAFAAVRVVADGGCMLSAAGRRGVKVSEGVVRLNGLELVPEGDARILLNARAQTIDSTGTVRVQLRAPGISPIVLFRGRLAISLRAERRDGVAAARASAAGRCDGQRLARFDAGAAELKGFPIEGSIEVFLQPETACIPVALGLPKAFGGIRGDAVLRASNARGLVVDSLRIAVGRAFVGPLLLRDLAVDYDAGSGDGERWSGSARLGLPPQPGGAELAAAVRFAGGRFVEGTLDLRLPFPGVALDPFLVSYLEGVRGRFGLDPLTLGAGASFGILPLAPPLYTFEVDGHLDVIFTAPIRFVFTGEGKLFGFPIANETITATTDGFARAVGRIGIDLSAATVRGELDAFVDARSGTFGGDVVGEVCVFGLCPRQEAVISSTGIGACIGTTVLGAKVSRGFGYRWGDSPLEVDLMFLDCDVSAYRVVPPPGAGAAARARAQAGARAAANGVHTVTVKRGERVLSLRVTGSGGPPAVTLVAPSGERLDPAAPGSRAIARTVTELNATYVGVVRPAAGLWRVEPTAASSAIAAVAQARPLPVPRVRARVGGKGRSRVLRYRASSGNGLTTTFAERWRGGERRIGRANGAAGAIRFAPGPGPAGRREIVALVARDGIPRSRTVVARYVAPPPLRLARVRGLRVVHRGGALVVRWRGVAAARAYAVQVDLPDGSRRLTVVGAAARSVRIGGVGRRVRATVRVKARDASGRAGPVAVARG